MHAGDRYEPPPTVTGGKSCVTIALTEVKFSRKHLFLDLQPYTCFYVNCPWSATPFADRQLWSKHLELDHRLGPSWDSSQCPLCLKSTESGKSAILIHFARHMEDIALAALPRDVESDAESEASSERTASSTNSKMMPPSTLRESTPLKLLEGTLPSFAHLLVGLEGPRCKVYELRNYIWHDRGTGRCVCTAVPLETPRILVRSDADPSFRLIDLRPTTDHGFNKQQDTLLIWTELDGTKMALSFQEPEGCDDCWVFLNRWCPQLDFENIIPLDDGHPGLPSIDSVTGLRSPGGVAL
jgi:hypothetical protein